jgi:hypothetical protein
MAARKEMPVLRSHGDMLPSSEATTARPVSSPVVEATCVYGDSGWKSSMRCVPIRSNEVKR